MTIKVDFMLIGAQKAGTTSLSYQLSQHPEISFCIHKEPNFFSKTSDWADRLGEYHSLYNTSPGKVYGEGSTTYTWIPEYPETATRLFTYNPRLKLIYLMRQPVERTLSHYTHHLLRARTRYPPDIEVFEVPTYINHSRYGLQIRPYLELFPRENILFIIFEEYTLNPLHTLSIIAEHIGVDPKGFDGIDLSPQYQSASRIGDKKIKKWITPIARLFPLKVRNTLRGPFTFQLKSKVDFSVKTKQLLWRFLEDDVQAIELILGQSLDVWRYPPYCL